MKISKMTFLKQKLRKQIGESITFVDVLERIYNKTRGQHNTIALVRAAQKTKGLILCQDEETAEIIRKEHKVDAMVYTDAKLFSYQGPVMMELPVMFKFVQAHSRLEKSATELCNFMDLKKID